MQYTAEQQAILDARDQPISVAVSAGAGCGKTFILTQRFLSFLHADDRRTDPLSRIVAITFTEKAGREMRHRVRVACHEALLHCDDDAVPHWLGILRGLDTARISTIHAYCATLLRTYAVEAGLDPGFGLLDPSFGDLFTQKTVRDVLCRRLAAHDPDAMELVARFDFEPTVAHLRDLLKGIHTADPDEIERHTPESLLAAWQTHWSDECAPQLAREHWESFAVRAVVELLEANEPSHATMQARRATLLHLLQGEPSADSAVLNAIVEHARVQGGGGAGSWSDPEVYSAMSGALKSLRESTKKLGDKCRIAEGDGTDAATVALTAHRVVRAVSEEYSARKQAESQLDFDDLLCLSRNLLRDHEFVRQRAAANIDLLMVDEFQDTDPVQAEIVRLLCGEQLASGKLFLVGDAKQSIYRFRGADPRVFDAMRNVLPEAGRLPLTTNFRSQPAILRFVNETFRSEIPGYEPLVAADSQQYSPEPCVEFLFASPEDQQNAEVRRRHEARWVAGRIAELLHDPTPRVLDSKSKELRRVQAGDVAILFRTLSNVALYEQALVERGLDYFLAGGRAFFAQQETNDIAHLVRWLEDPSDELSLAGVLRSPLFGLNDDTLYLLKPEPRSSIMAGLASPPRLPESQAEQVRRADQILAELRAKKDQLPLAELLSLAVARTGYDAALLCEHLGPRKLANLRKLIGLARSFDAAGPYTLSEFASRLSDAVREETDEELAVTHPEVSDVLRLMTIHQSKGLEFPVVIVADMDWTRHGGHARAVYHPRLGPLISLPDDGDGRPDHPGRQIHHVEEAQAAKLEQMRLLYVALTRARDHLILSAGLSHDRQPRSPWLKLLARHFDLETGLPVLDPYFGSGGGKAVRPAEISNVRVHRHEPSHQRTFTARAADLAHLAELRDVVGRTTPGPLPSLVKIIPPALHGRREFTTTELVKADDQSDGKPPAEQIADDEAASRPQGGSGSRDAARIVGDVSHAVLEFFDFDDPAAFEDRAMIERIERSLLAMRGDADPDIVRRVLIAVRSLVDSPLGRELSSARRLHREVEFRLHWHQQDDGSPAEIKGTIDCLFQDASGDWHIIDYKAIADVSKSEAVVVNQYQLQLAVYAMAVERLFGTLPKTARLARLGSPLKIHEVSLAAESMTDAANRIDTAIASLRAGDVSPEVEPDIPSIFD